MKPRINPAPLHQQIRGLKELHFSGITQTQISAIVELIAQTMEERAEARLDLDAGESAEYLRDQATLAKRDLIRTKAAGALEYILRTHPDQDRLAADAADINAALELIA